MSGYLKNIWNSYDKTLPEDINLRNNAIITAEKLRKMEQGIYDANLPIEIGTVKVVEPDEPAAINIIRQKDKMIVNIDLPRAKVDPELVREEITYVKDELTSVTSRVYCVLDGEPIPEYTANDIVVILEPEENDNFFTMANFLNLLIDEEYPTTGEYENFGDYDLDENGNPVMVARMDTADLANTSTFAMSRTASSGMGIIDPSANNKGTPNISNLHSGILTVDTEPRPDTYFFADTDEE